MSIKRARRVKRKPKKGITWSAIRKANKKRKASSLEVTVYEWLTEANLSFKKEKAIGRCHVDVFLEPNVILEIQGCYWHRCRVCYPTKTKSNSNIRLKDSNRHKFFRSKEFIVLELWEHEVLEDPDKAKEDLLRRLGELL